MPPFINFTTPLALSLAFLAIPIILLYLLKPRPKQVKFPSIIFISRIDKSKRFTSFFRRFIRDPLLLVQLLILLLLVLSIANPFFLSSKAYNPRTNAVLIFDGSASMQAKDVSPSRFKKAQELAEIILKGLHPESKISLIFAGQAPWLLLKESTDKEKAEEIVRNLRASDAPSNLEDALLFGNDLLSSTGNDLEKRIYLFSDFSQVGDVILGKGISLHRGVQVDFIKVSQGGRNVGIVSLKGQRFLDEANKCYLTWVVKNFNLQDEEVQVDLFLDKNMITSLKKDLLANTSALFYWKGNVSLQEHELTVKIKGEDDLALDDEAYWILPEVKKYHLLLITNHNGYLKDALEANPDFLLSIARPPVIPKIEKNEFAAVILGDFDNDLILPGTFLELKNYLEGGGNLIVVASEGLYHCRNNDNLQRFLPLKLEKIIPAKTLVKKAREHEILKDVILNNVILEKYLKSQIKGNQSKILATSKSSPLIVLNENHGKFVYVGINPNPKWSNFYLSSSLPIFWSQLISWLNKEEYFPSENYQSGQHVFFEGENVQLTTPSKRTFMTREIILNEVGVYQANLSSNQFQRISVNLVSEDESNIASSLSVKTLNDRQFNLIQATTLEPNFLLDYLLILLLILLAIEIILYKRRGLI